MSAFLERDKVAFEEYALQVAVISLKHALSMESFNWGIKQLAVPVTLSAIGRNSFLDQWSNIFDKHLPYQFYGEYLMSNADEIQTPKGIF